jgi:hypothetical protein
VSTKEKRETSVSEEGASLNRDRDRFTSDQRMICMYVPWNTESRLFLKKIEKNIFFTNYMILLKVLLGDLPLPFLIFHKIFQQLCGALGVYGPGKQVALGQTALQLP